MKVLIVLCLGLVSVQAFPKLAASPALKDDFDDLIKELDILNSLIEIEEINASKVVTDGLEGVRKLKGKFDYKLIDDLKRASEILAEQVHDLERQASEYDVDITECIGDQLEKITDYLPAGFVYLADSCASLVIQKVQSIIGDGRISINLIVAPVREYLAQIEQCRDSDPTEQETCVPKLSTEIKDDEIQIPVKYHLILDETLANIEPEKTTLQLCFDDQIEPYNKIAGDTVAEITECAERLFPSSSLSH